MSGGRAETPHGGAGHAGGQRLTVLAIVADQATRELLPKVVRERLLVTDDLAEVPTLALEHSPEVAFVEIGLHDGAGLALVHHLKAVVPDLTVYALSSRHALEAAANAVALGGAGLIMMPVGGDEIQSAISAVKLTIADRAKRVEVERAARAYTRMRGYLERVAALAGCPSRTAAAEQLAQVLVEATGALGAAVYLCAGERTTELTRAASSPALDRAPPLGMEPDVLAYAARAQLLAVPLAAGAIKAGLALIARRPGQQVPAVTRAPGAPQAPPDPGAGLAPRVEETAGLLAALATPALALLAERERQAGATIKDPASSAYSFAYYVDVAGREIDKARRYGRRFAIATVAFEASEGESRAPPMSHAEMADQLLRAARDTDVLAQVDEHEFHLLMPETDGLGAHAARRRVLARLLERGGKVVPRGMLVGVSTFPHDGADLSQLLRVARRRAEATRFSLVRRIATDQTGLVDLLEAFGWELEVPPPEVISAARVLDLPLHDVAGLAAAVVGDAVRGGGTLIVVAHHEGLALGAAVRAALGPARENVTLHALDVRDVRAAGPGETIEALAVLAEHGAYALIGRREGGGVRGLHAADPLLADLLAERLGRAAGLRLFT